MRTTLTLEPDIALKLKRLMQRRRLSLKQAVNDALRRGLAMPDEPPERKFRVEPHSCRFKPGIDLDKMNQLVDELEADAVRRKISR